MFYFNKYLHFSEERVTGECFVQPSLGEHGSGKPALDVNAPAATAEPYSDQGSRSHAHQCTDYGHGEIHKNVRKTPFAQNSRELPNYPE